MNRLSLTVGLAAMDLGWAYPWAVLLALWTNRPEHVALLAAGTILTLELLGAWTTHLLGRRIRTLAQRPARLTVAGLAVLAAIVAVRIDVYGSSAGLDFDWIGTLATALATAIGDLSAPVVAFALAIYLWWRGVRLGSQTPSFTDVEGGFRWGIGRLAVFGLVMTVTTRPGVLPSLEAATTPYVVGFFFVSLITLALGRLESLRTRTLRPSLNSQWLTVLILVAGAVVLLALLLGQLLSFDLLILATRPIFDLLGFALLVLAYMIVIPLAYIVQWLVYLVLSLIQPNINRPPPEPQQPSDLNNALQKFLAEQLSPEVVLALKAIGAALVLGFALVLVARALSRWRPSSADADATNEERDSLWRTDLRAILLEWLRRIFRRGQRSLAATGEATEMAADAKPGAERSTVRALYAALLREGEAVGAPRVVSTTPYEHLPSLEARLAPDAALDHLTEAYVRERYAEVSVSQGEVASLNSELQNVHSKGAVG